MGFDWLSFQVLFINVWCDAFTDDWLPEAPCDILLSVLS